MNEAFYRALCAATGAEHVFCDEPMKAHTSFHIGGPADFFVTPENIQQLEEILALCKEYGEDYFVLGNGTNLLVSDEGFRGVILQLLKNWNSCRIEGNVLTAGAGILLSRLSKLASEASLTGLEFASGIPGTLGGALVMNAGAYGGEIKDVLVRAKVFKPGIGVETLEPAALQLGYRTSIFKHSDWIALEASVALEPGEQARILARMEELKNTRNEKQPLDLPSAGSAFKRPEGYFAGKLIMDAGLKGYTIGGAAVSEKHCGFFVNKGGATAKDVRTLFRHVIETVRNDSGVTLEPEVRFLGRFEE